MFFGITERFRDYFLGYFVIDFPIGLAVTIDGAFFPIVVVLDASTTLADEFIVFGSFFRCNLFLFMLD